MARSLRRGSTAWDAAGTIHGEIQQRLRARRGRRLGGPGRRPGGYAAARDRGVLRTEGRAYVVADGDVITIKV